MIGTGLMELADRTYAFESGQWKLKARPKPFSAYAAVVFNFGRNDSNNSEDTPSFGAAFDKMLAQGAKYFPKVISGSPPPRAMPDLSAFDIVGDNWQRKGYEALVAASVARWNPRHVDLWRRFQDEVTSGRHTVAELMRDAWHQSWTTGFSLESAWIAAALRDPVPATAATPELAGDVVTYLWGEPAAGTWTLTPFAGSSGGDTGSPVTRVSGLPGQAMVASADGARLVFPTAAMKQVWVHALIGTGGGVVHVYVDRGTPNEVKIAWGTDFPNAPAYFRSTFVAGGLGAGVHTVELETEGAGPVQVVGVTYVGVP